MQLGGQIKRKRNKQYMESIGCDIVISDQAYRKAVLFYKDVLLAFHVTKYSHRQFYICRDAVIANKHLYSILNAKVKQIHLDPE